MQLWGREPCVVYGNYQLQIFPNCVEVPGVFLYLQGSTEEGAPSCSRRASCQEVSLRGKEGWISCSRWFLVPPCLWGDDKLRVLQSDFEKADTWFLKYPEQDPLASFTGGDGVLTSQRYCCIIWNTPVHQPHSALCNTPTPFGEPHWKRSGVASRRDGTEQSCPMWLIHVISAPKWWTSHQRQKLVACLRQQLVIKKWKNFCG